jgi:hypothetical protein
MGGLSAWRGSSAEASRRDAAEPGRVEVVGEVYYPFAASCLAQRWITKGEVGEGVNGPKPILTFTKQ